MVGPNGLEPSTSSVSRKRSNQTELRAYVVYSSAGSNERSGSCRLRTIGDNRDFIMPPAAGAGVKTKPRAFPVGRER